VYHILTIVTSYVGGKITQNTNKLKFASGDFEIVVVLH